MTTPGPPLGVTVLVPNGGIPGPSMGTGKSVELHRAERERQDRAFPQWGQHLGGALREHSQRWLSVLDRDRSRHHAARIRITSLNEPADDASDGNFSITTR